MARPALEVADILRDHGPAWREANRGHVSLEQLKVMSAIENKRVVYDLLMKAAAETTLAIASDPSASARGSVSPPCCTPGARRSPTIRTCT